MYLVISFYIFTVLFFKAVKCNPDMAVLKVLTDLGAFFDCGSKVNVKDI